MRTWQGARSAMLLLDGFSALVEGVLAELARQGHPHRRHPSRDRVDPVPS